MICLLNIITLEYIFQQKYQAEDKNSLPPDNSPVTDLLNTCTTLGILDYVKEMVAGDLLSKAKWKRIVWDSAWTHQMQEWEEPIVLKELISTMTA